ncbi:hypothetical protein GQ56_0134080 [Burkholderia paludis]|uniref:hypothetical protein n=1 Tax=Burkholderia paludis TaxID=1506587 RepID=UPI0004DB54CF|nr:hypothetical protein [Burkholderia paludis]KFG92971.1 hypothetical protein GQ56_0134080 [Burkholderia paludis]
MNFNKTTMALSIILDKGLTGLITIVTSGIGAFLALRVKEKYDRREQLRTADLDEFKKITSHLSHAVVNALLEQDFLAGVRRNEFYTPLYELRYEYQDTRTFVFHEKALNTQFQTVLVLTGEFMNAIAELTVREGDELTTRPRAERVYYDDDTRRRHAEDAKTLNAKARELGNKCRMFLDAGKQLLRT